MTTRGTDLDTVITTIVSSNHAPHAKDPETHPSLYGHTQTITAMVLTPYFVFIVFIHSS